MFKSRFFKLTLIVMAFVIVFSTKGLTVQARPDYLKKYVADPLSKVELRNCALCHVNPAGGGPRNEFGKAFAAAGLEFTAELRQKFPQNFRSDQEAQPPVSFVSDSEAVVEINGKKFVINTKTKTVKEMTSGEKAPTQVAAVPTPSVEKHDTPSNVYRQADVRLINLPTAMPIAKGSLWTDFTHRFPFGEPTDTKQLFGLDTIAAPSFGFIYGVTDRVHVGVYRSPSNLGRPIQLSVGASLLDEQKGDPVSVMARVGLEGRDNFQRNFAGSFELTLARSITNQAQIYVVPTVTVGDRPIGYAPEQNLPGETAAALGAGLAVNVRPTVALLSEFNMRLNEASRYNDPDSGIGMHRPVFGFAVQKVSESRRHSFTLSFTNGYGTTMSQRSMTRGLIGADDTWRGLTIGFNLSRRLF
ncbi:MAG: hypothetical protein KA368_05255 [Acidobacteria bacterium]|nr:hypothetical protein [Acidobacteriota bacterium]